MEVKENDGISFYEHDRNSGAPKEIKKRKEKKMEREGIKRRRRRAGLTDGKSS